MAKTKRTRARKRGPATDGMIRRRLAELRWAVRYTEPGPVCEIVSDVFTRTHEITLVESGLRPHDYLHEIAHARLAEDVSPLMSTALFHPSVYAGIIVPLVGIFRVAMDWFCDELLFAWAPELVRREVMAAYSSVHENASGLHYEAALFAAQYIRYVGPLSVHPRVSGTVGVFISIDPSQPSIEAMERLINGLLAERWLYRVRAVEDPHVVGVTVWDMRKEES